MADLSLIRSRAERPDAKHIQTPPGKTRAPAPTRSPRVLRTLRRCGIAVLGVALVLTGLSLSHLAEGTRLVTGCDAPSAFAMATGIDLSFVSLEISLLYAPGNIRQDVASFAVPAIRGTMALSAAMNALSFSEHSHGWMIYPAIGLGLAIPALIYCLTRTGATLWRVAR